MNWLQSLSVTEHIFFWIAIVASVLLIIQIIMLLVSFAGMDSDISDTFEGDVDGDGGLSIFSVKAITAFFSVGGWCGFATATYVDNVWLPILVSVLTGAVALVGVAFAMKGIMKLQCSGNVVKEKIVGSNATVYASIPPTRSGRGKITLTVQGKFSELDAVTDDENRIATDEVVEIVAYEDDFAVVKKQSSKEKF